MAQSSNIEKRRDNVCLLKHGRRQGIKGLGHALVVIGVRKMSSPFLDRLPNAQRRALVNPF